MVKLKCWKNVRGRGVLVRGVTMFKKDKGNLSPIGESSSVDIWDKGKIVEVEIWNKKDFKKSVWSPSLKKKFKSKTQATKFANSYMKKHDKC